MTDGGFESQFKCYDEYSSEWPWIAFWRSAIASKLGSESGSTHPCTSARQQQLELQLKTTSSASRVLCA